MTTTTAESRPPEDPTLSPHHNNLPAERHGGRRLLQRILMPIAQRLRGTNPNVLTACGFAIAALASAAYLRTDSQPCYFLISMGLVIAYGLMDGLDGLVARLGNRTSAWGDFLDHTCDRATMVMGFCGIAATAHGHAGLVLGLALLTLFHGYLGTQMEASTGVRCYRGIGTLEAIIALCVYNIAAYVLATQTGTLVVRVPVLEIRATLTNVFAVVGAAATLVAIVQRLRRAYVLIGKTKPVGRTEPPASGS